MATKFFRRLLVRRGALRMCEADPILWAIVIAAIANKRPAARMIPASDCRQRR
jgi:hypothetical protein